MINIGIIGLGFVGGSINKFFSNKAKVRSYDINGLGNSGSIEEVFNNSDFIFVCIPTPMKKSGECDTSIVESVLIELSKINSEDKIIILKSTVPLGCSEKFASNLKIPNLIFNPEFLTEANAYEDFVNQDRIILGGIDKFTNKAESFFRIFFDNKVAIIKTNYTTAELVKYTTNCFLATKVSFANEIHSISEHFNLNFSELMSIVTLDSRINNSHLKVPGPDGKKGYGGSCFPKDMNALKYTFESNGIQSTILKGSIERNENIDRVEKDWEKLKGRAVSE